MRISSEKFARRVLARSSWYLQVEAMLLSSSPQSFIAVPEPQPLNCSALKIMLTALGVVGLLATAGYLGGLVQGGGNQFLLAICCGALGAFVVLLGYGPIALLVGALAAVAEWFHRKKNGPRRK